MHENEKHIWKDSEDGKLILEWKQNERPSIWIDQVLFMFENTDQMRSVAEQLLTVADKWQPTATVTWNDDGPSENSSSD